MATQTAEYHSERSLPTVIGILVNATFVDAVTTRTANACATKTFGQWR